MRFSTLITSLLPVSALGAPVLVWHLSEAHNAGIQAYQVAIQNTAKALLARLPREGFNKFNSAVLEATPRVDTTSSVNLTFLTEESIDEEYVDTSHR